MISIILLQIKKLLLQLDSIVATRFELSIEKLLGYKWLKNIHKGIKAPKVQALYKTKTLALLYTIFQKR